MDFYQFRIKEVKGGTKELYPGFIVGRSKDLMVRGGQFYAIWDEEKGLWSTDEYDVARLVDEEMRAFAKKYEEAEGMALVVKNMLNFETGSWSIFQKYVNQVGDNSHQLDENLTFANTEVKKNDYVSRRLPYSLASGDISAWDELVGTLYSVENRAKIEWMIGAIVSGDAKKIQKFGVFYGAPGSGKGTILVIVEKLFAGYTTAFSAKDLGSNNAQFATEVFKNNPLVAIQADGDLSRIEDNSRLNTIISHEYMTMNEKFKSSYTERVNAFLLMGTNKPVKISDAKSGIIRRLIDIHPTGVRIPINHYNTLISKVDFELGAIAYHCLEVYRSMGKNFYEGYRPMEMMLQTDVFFNFIEAYFDVFKEQNGVSLTQAYLLYKEYCGESGIERIMAKYKFREELRNYFDEFKDRAEVGGHLVRSYYEGFNANKFKAPAKEGNVFSLVMEETESIFDEMAADWSAQYEVWDEEQEVWRPERKWTNSKTKLKDLDTTQIHYVRVPLNHIVIDFDLKGEDGEKSLERNLEAASVWPATYAELSKSGAGVHLHYLYEGDVSELAGIYSEGIEVKTLLGDAALRRRLSKCNNIPVAVLNMKLPVKEKKVLGTQTIASEKGLRELIARNLRKEVHPGTKPSVDFIKHILDEAYESGMQYDVTDLRNKITAFANNSSNQPLPALKVVQQMKFASEPAVVPDDPSIHQVAVNDDRIAFFDVEVFPNLFVLCWKFAGDTTTIRMINPTAQECEHLLKLKLVGFYNRRYDNHILYAAIQGYNNEQLFQLSQKIIEEKNANAMFGNAYNISYADIWDFSSKKQGLKKFQIELGIPHVELNIPWDQPVPEERWEEVADYCVNDVISTEVTFESRKQDFIARQILADLSGLSVNDTTQRHTAKIIFGNDRHPQAQFVYTDLSKEFPGYEFDPTKKIEKSTYKGEDPSEGGYVHAEPGMYENVDVYDVASMHPTSIVQLNLFGEYTPNFKALLDARMAIKHKDYDSAKKMLGGKLKPHLDNPADADALAYALKIVINIVYGLTSAKFDNPFRDLRNRDNIVAKRGALFMIDLKHFVQEQGFQVVHIKTDSIKIPNATPELTESIFNFGEKYGYNFEHEATYEKFCLVNDAVYIAKKLGYAPGEVGEPLPRWEAVGAQFQQPYVYKTLFSHEPIVFDDLCETKQVTQGAMYLDFQLDRAEKPTPESMQFVGRTGRFVPVKEGSGGAMLYRVKDDKPYAVTGTKGHLWMEAEMVASRDDVEIDMSYFDKMVNDAVETINKFGDFDKFVQ